MVTMATAAKVPIVPPKAGPIRDIEGVIVVESLTVIFPIVYFTCISW